MQDFWTQNNCFLLQSAVQSYGFENATVPLQDYPWADFSLTFFDGQKSAEELRIKWKAQCDLLKQKLELYKQKYPSKFVDFFIPYPIMKGFSDTADQVLPNLWISSASITKDVEALHSKKIKAVLNCSDPGTTLSADIYHAQNIAYMCLNIQDVAASKQVLEEKLKQALQFIDKQDSVVVNCSAGVSRSATVVLAWLMSRKQMSLVDAFTFLRSKRRFVYPNKGFWSLLISLDDSKSVPPQILEMHGQIQEIHLKIN